MRILSADTSSNKFSIALLENGTLVDQYEPASLNMHSSDLIPAIDKLLSKNSCTAKEIDGFCIGIGPGSFTGLRVGVTTMRALALALDKPIVGVPSIDAIAYNLFGNKNQVCVLIDAKQNKVYARTYKFINKRLEFNRKVLLLSIDELLKKIKVATIFSGDGLKVYKDKIMEELKDASFAPDPFWLPKAAIIGKLGYKRLKAGKKDNVLKLSPLYIYPKECQVKKSR